MGCSSGYLRGSARCDFRAAVSFRLGLLALFLTLGPQFAARASANRVALVIGNAAYPESPLRNPVNDARAMARRLEALGFDVIALQDADRETMARAIQSFASRLERDTTGLFYYAGHGIQARGRNYLIPVDADLDTERALRFEAIDVTGVLEEMEIAQNRVNLVILDACRNNPFERRFRGGPKGLAAIDAARGTLIAYATAPGSVAADGLGKNGLYTEELLRALAVPGLKAEDVFKRVRVAVSDKTHGQQVPWESSSLTGDLIFNLSVEVEAPQAPSVPSTADREALFWETIKSSDNPADFEAYLAQYPRGTFASLARNRLQTFDERASAPGQGSDHTRIAKLEPQSQGSATEPVQQQSLLLGLYKLLKSSEGSKHTMCEADASQKICKGKGIGINLVAPIPGRATHDSILIRDVVLDQRSSAIRFVAVNHGSYLGISAACSDSNVVLRVRSAGDIRTLSWEYFCNWLVIGNISFRRTHSIDYIDLKNGILGGFYEMSGSGFPAFGSGSGYSLMKLKEPAGEFLGSSRDSRSTGTGRDSR